MRTPNTSCVVCDKPLYRRPSDMARTRYAACMEHRVQAQTEAGITDVQLAALALGREKGTNHLNGIPKSEESKRRRSVAMKRWCKKYPDRLAARSVGTRGSDHYNWNGGTSRLNISIRQMTENRNWMDAVKERDGVCVQCGSTDTIESHHIEPLAEIIARLDVTSRKDAREHVDELWNLDNGITLCQRCHYGEHGRMYAD